MYNKIKNSYSRKLLITALVCVVLPMMGGCKKKAPTSDPKQTLSTYVDRSFKVNDPKDRDQLLELMTGDLRNRFGSWSDEQFKQGFIDNKRKYVKLSFRDQKQISANQISLTYELTYDDLTRQPATRVTTRRIATMQLSEKGWLIAEVKNIKELIEYQNELSIP